jgi:hypothetical protein
LEKKELANSTFRRGMRSIGHRITLFMWVEWEEIPKKDWLMDALQHPPNDLSGTLGQRRSNRRLM